MKTIALVVLAAAVAPVVFLSLELDCLRRDEGVAVLAEAEGGGGLR